MIVDNERVVRDGNIIKGGGVTAGIDFALVAIAEIFGRDVAEAVELRVEYAPAPPFGVGSPEIAPPELESKVRDDLSPSLAAWYGCRSGRQHAQGGMTRQRHLWEFPQQLRSARS